MVSNDASFIYFKNISVEKMNSYILKSVITDYYSTMIIIKHSNIVNNTIDLKLSIPAVRNK